MRVVFMGAQSWGNATLRALADAGHDIPLAVTHPGDEEVAESIWRNEVAAIAAERGIPCIEAVRADETVAAAIASARPDVIVASNWRTWISPAVCGLAASAAFNVHDSLLPCYGGLSVINWAVANGETETGVTVHCLAEQIDLGDIVLQQQVPIGPRDTATDVLGRALELCGELPVRALEQLADGTLERRPQDPRQATFFHRRTERDWLIDWRADAATVHNLVRAQSDPYPNAWTLHRGERLRVKRTSAPSRTYLGTPGRVVCRDGDGVVVICGGGAERGAVVVEAVARDGGPEISAAHYFERFGEQLGAELAWAGA